MTTERAVISLGRCLVLSALFVPLQACEDRPPTQVLISLATDLDAPVPLQRVTMRIDRFSTEQNDFMPIDQGDLTTDWLIRGLPENRFELPGSFVAFSDGNQEPKIRVTVEGRTPEGAFIRRRSILRLVKEKTLFLRMGVTSRCLDNADCPDDKTCIEGRCREAEIISSELPIYDPNKRPEFSFECNSGTAFRNTSTRELLVSQGSECPNPGDVCSEGTCYRPTVFDKQLPPKQRVEVMVQLTDPAGMAILGADVRVEDGPVSLVRRLRSGPTTQMLPAPLDTGNSSPANPAGSPGLYRLQAQVEALTTELRLTVNAGGHAPQVVTVPYKAGVNRYMVPVVVFPLQEQTLAMGETRPMMVEYAGRTATLTVAADMREQRIRYALLDGRFAPGGAVPAGTSDLLQSVAVLYLENAGQGSFPPGTKVTVGTGSTAPVVGAETSGGAYILDLQGQWKRRAEAGSSGSPAGELVPSTGGFWTVAKRTPRPACVKGKILKSGRQPCTGARVRLLGPEGVSSFDSSGPDGSFCGAAAQAEAAILGVGGHTQTIYVPATARVGAQCSQGDACSDIGEVTVPDADCDNPPLPVAGRRQPGEGCANTLECGALSSCYQNFCVGEGFVRVSMTWAARSDFDLHVRLPGGGELNERSRELSGVGRMDIEQCAQQCLGDKHVENVVLSTGAPTGEYQVWVENFGGAAAGTAQLEVLVAGTKRTQRPVDVPASADGKSEVITFTLP